MQARCLRYVCGFRLGPWFLTPGELSLSPMSLAKKKANTPKKVRDHVEGIYIAIVLAFVLRAFLLEAFVIPTGSMANALYGEHLSLVCPSCQIDYTYGIFLLVGGLVVPLLFDYLAWRNTWLRYIVDRSVPSEPHDKSEKGDS